MENNNFLSHYIEKKALCELASPLEKALSLADGMLEILRTRPSERDEALSSAEDLILSLAKTLTVLDECLAKTKPLRS